MKGSDIYRGKNQLGVLYIGRSSRVKNRLIITKFYEQIKAIKYWRAKKLFYEKNILSRVLYVNES